MPGFALFRNYKRGKEEKVKKGIKERTEEGACKNHKYKCLHKKQQEKMERKKNKAYIKIYCVTF